MNYEIDFIGIDEETDNADAICFQYYSDELDRYVIGVYDGGTQKYGDALVEHLNAYYFDNQGGKIDFIICSHTDQDHASGLSILFDNFEVGALVMNRPWLYVDDIFDKVNDGRITRDSLEKKLKECYPYAKALEDQAFKYGVEIYSAFQGTTIYKDLVVLSPSKDFYLDLLIESNKTPLSESSALKDGVLKRIATVIKMAVESWTDELLREDVKTSAENEASVILFGNMIDHTFLLTGDAGIRALDAAIEYANIEDIKLQEVKVQQIPHHGGRHNVSPSVLDKLLGKKVAIGEQLSKTAIVSVSKGSSHPKKMVTNAYIRRGVKVCEARESTLRHYKGMPQRKNWGAVTPLSFTENVEDWD